MAVPVRLIQRDGGIISLDCTNYIVQMNRGVMPIPVPVTGERVAVDLNANSASIRLDCVLRDDDCSSLDLAKKASQASIDFGRVAAAFTTTEDDAGLAYMSDDGGSVTISSLNGKSFDVKSTYLSTNNPSQSITVKFDTSTVNHTATAFTLTVGLSGVSDSGATLTTAVYNAMTTHTGNFSSQVADSGGTTFSSAFTVTKGTGQLKQLGGGDQTKITLVQKDKGVKGNSVTPVFWTDDLATVERPYVITFSGGSTNSCKSAGDKVQDLIANVVNSNVAGLTGGLFNQGDRESLWSDYSLAESLHKDYIIGLQIPFNSLTQSTLGAVGDPVQGYETRNLLMVTGLTSPGSQNSEGNVLPAGVLFDVGDLGTGIRGTVTGCDIQYEAGETIYNATITFHPIDLIIGT